MDFLKKIGKIFLVLFVCLCVGIDAWYLYIEMYGKTKFTSATVNVNELTLSDGTKKDIIEVKYKRNANKNGLECFDLKLNYLTDENKDNFYSQGVQYVANNVSDKIIWNDRGSSTKYQVKEFSKVFWKGKYYAEYYSPTITKGKKYEYQSYNDFETLGSTNPITSASYFTLQLGGNEDDIVYMQLKGDNYAKYQNGNVVADQDESIGYWSKEGTFKSEFVTHFYDYTIDYLAYSLYESVNTLPAGTKGKFVFEFGNMFKYYLNDNGRVGEEIISDDTTRVINNIKSYYTISVEVSDDGVKNSKDSLFGVVHGNATYSVKPSYGESGNYFSGKAFVMVSEENFDIVEIEKGYCALKLKESFKQKYSQCRKDICLDIKIDVSKINEKGYKYVGFSNDSGLSDFVIYRTQILNAEVQK